MAYCRWSNSNWYIFRHVSEDPTWKRNNQIIAIAHVNAANDGNPFQKFKYPEVKKMLKTGSFKTLIDYLTGDEFAFIEETLQRFIDDVDADFGKQSVRKRKRGIS